jgi:hypothetical protein
MPQRLHDRATYSRNRSMLSTSQRSTTGRNFPIPARSAIPARITLQTSGAGKTFLGPYGAPDSTSGNRSIFLPDHCSRDANGKIFRKPLRVLGKAFRHHFPLPRREPETDARNKFRDFHDGGKMFQTLEIPAIMPAENPFRPDLASVLFFQQGNHCTLPGEHITQKDFQPASLSLFHYGKGIHPAIESVAGKTYASLFLGQNRSELARLSGEPVCETRHF